MSGMFFLRHTVVRSDCGDMGLTVHDAIHLVQDRDDPSQEPSCRCVPLQEHRQGTKSSQSKSTSKAKKDEKEGQGRGERKREYGKGGEERGGRGLRHGC